MKNRIADQGEDVELNRTIGVGQAEHQDRHLRRTGRRPRFGRILLPPGHDLRELLPLPRPHRPCRRRPGRDPAWKEMIPEAPAKPPRRFCRCRVQGSGKPPACSRMETGLRRVYRDRWNRWNRPIRPIRPIRFHRFSRLIRSPRKTRTRSHFFSPSSSLTPVHSGYPVQPQNPLPAFLPLLAVRRVIALPQSGQTGAASCFARASTRRLWTPK